MNKPNSSTASISAICAATLLVGLPFAAGTAGAADLPITKAPAKIPDPGNPFWAEVDYLAWSVKGDRPPPLVTFAGDDDGGCEFVIARSEVTSKRILAARGARSFADRSAPLKNRGRRESRVRAAPAVSCANWYW